jgi:hypothetical protein
MVRDNIVHQPVVGEGPPSNVPPAAFGRFRVLHQIGAGSLGPVFRAEDPASHTAVVIKVLRLNLTPERARIVADELTALQDRVPAHPGIAPMVKAGIRDVEPFVVSAFMPGDSLDVTLRDLGRSAIAEALPRLVQLAAGLDFCADASICHGGLHPRDVLVSATGTAVVGVGIASILERVGVKLPVRRPYTAPEVVDGLMTSPAADQFSLAAMVFEWLYGRRIAGPAEGRIEVPDLAGVDRAAMADAFTTALAIDPGVRFESSSAFVAALADAVEKKPRVPRSKVVNLAARRSRLPALTSMVPSLPREEQAALPLHAVLPEAPDEDDVVAAPSATTADDLRFDHEVREERSPEGYLTVVETSPGLSWAYMASALLVAIAIGGGIGYWFVSRPAARAKVTAPAVASTPSAPATAAAMSAIPSAPAPVETAKPTEQLLPAPVPVPVPVPKDVPAATALPTSEPSIGPAPSTEHVGRVLVRSTPAGAEVTVNGERRGVTPLALRDLPFGGYSIAVSRAGYSSEQQQVTLTPARPAQSLELDLVGRPGGSAAVMSGGSVTSSTIVTPGATIGSLMIDSRPIGATVFVDGSAAGITPLVLDRLEPGPHAIRLERTGYHPWTTTVSVVPGELTRLAASLAGGQEQE